MSGSQALWISITLSATACSLLGPRGYEFTFGDPGPVVVDTGLVTQIARLANHALDTWPDVRPLAHADSQPELARRNALTGSEVTAESCSSLQPFFSAVHLSDVQLKDHRVVIEGTFPAGFYDHFASGAVRHPALERYDQAVFLATVLGINAMVAAEPGGSTYAPCPDPIAPEMVIHTGDAVDAGMFSELLEFLTIAARLQVPFFDITGNHDVLFFGTFPTQDIRGLNLIQPFIPIYDGRRFMSAHRWEYAEFDISIPYLPRDSHRPTRVGHRGIHIERFPRSEYHGYDLICRPQTTTLCHEARGYYAFDVEARGARLSAQRRVRFVALNTSEVFPDSREAAFSARSRGNMTAQQLAWIDSVTAAPGADIILVAGHHPFGSFVDDQGTRLAQMLASRPAVAAYLAGHTHVTAISKVPRSGGLPPLWAIVAGSVSAYPQFGLLVEALESSGAAGGYLRVRTFRQAYSDVGCGGDPDAASLACRAFRGRHGALRDTTDGAWRDDETAVDAGNWMLPISLPSSES